MEVMLQNFIKQSAVSTDSPGGLIRAWKINCRKREAIIRSNKGNQERAPCIQRKVSLHYEMKTKRIHNLFSGRNLSHWAEGWPGQLLGRDQAKHSFKNRIYERRSCIFMAMRTTTKGLHIKVSPSGSVTPFRCVSFCGLGRESQSNLKQSGLFFKWMVMLSHKADPQDTIMVRVVVPSAVPA